MDRSQVWIPATRPEKETWRSAFSCSKCRVYGSHTWKNLYEQKGYGENVSFEPFMSFATSTCFHCDHVMLWLGDHIVHPETVSVEFPNPDLPPTVQETYLEASSVVDKSPRAAAALMRLGLQQLCDELGVKGDLNSAIGTLVRDRGLPLEIQRALDVVRVIGNHAVHPGTIDLKDDRGTAAAMFSLVNLIAQKLISEPAAIDRLYERLPKAVRETIAERDTRGGEQEPLEPDPGRP